MLSAEDAADEFDDLVDKLRHRVGDVGKKLLYLALLGNDVLEVLLHLLDLFLESGGVELFHRAAQGDEAVDLAVAEGDAVLLGDLFDLLAQLVVSHVLSLVEDELELVYDRG